tara:strand:- start:1262 stop:1459 length:198 start_codon:yes stop_codon:yes gene_type:complete
MPSRTIKEIDASIDSTLERWREERELQEFREREERREIREAQERREIREQEVLLFEIYMENAFER